MIKLTRLSKFVPFASKTLLFFLLLVGGYYLLFLNPQIKYSRALLEAERVIGEHTAFNLLQNRIAFVELTKLDLQMGNFNFEKADLVSTLQKTGKDGLEQLEKGVKIPNINTQLKKRFPALIAETKEVYQNQDKLLKKVFATSTYADGIAIMKSPEAVELLTKQTNLILEYQFWLEEIN